MSHYLWLCDSLVVEIVDNENNLDQQILEGVNQENKNIQRNLLNIMDIFEYHIGKGYDVIEMSYHVLPLS